MQHADELPLWNGPESEEKRAARKPPRRRPKHYERRDNIMDSTLTQSEKDVLAVILRHMGFDDDCPARSAWCGEERIAIMASICVRTVRSTLKSLEARDVLKIQKRIQKPSLYTINFSRLKALADPRLAPGYKRTKGPRT